MYIYKALLHHGFSAFSLTILEYIDISNLSKKEARKVILEREQYYFDTLNPEYNLLKIAGSSLGHKHIEETLAKRSGENNHFYGKSHTTETKALISKTFTGRTLSADTKAKMSLAHKGKTLPTSTLEKLRKKVYVYDKDNRTTVFKEFNSYTEAAKYFE